MRSPDPDPEAQADRVREDVTALISRAIRRDVDALLVAGTVLGTAVMAVRLILGSASTADHLRELAADAEVEAMPYDA
jgi:hypothetical protein